MKPINELTTPALAYLGDAVIELYVREALVAAGSRSITAAISSFILLNKIKFLL